MKPIHYVLIVAGLLLLFFGIKYWDNIMEYFGFSKKEPLPSEYDKCISTNKSLPDGADCHNCVPEGSAMASFNGKIINGECTQIIIVEKPKRKYLIVSKQGGAHPYLIQGSIVSSLRMIVPYGQRLEYGQVITSPRLMYQTKYGFMDAVDVSLAKQEQDI